MTRPMGCRAGRREGRRAARLSGGSRALLVGGLVLGALGLGAGRVGAEAPSRAVTKGVVERSRVEVQPAGRAITQVTIENPLGDVKVEGYDGTSIQIETRKEAPDEEALDRLRVSLIPNPDGSVRISTTADGGKELRSVERGAVRIDLIVRAPRDARIAAAVGAGSLEVIDMDAGGELDTGSGRISVRNVAGVLSTNTVTGPTSLSQVFGSVDAQSLSSDLDLDTIGGARLVASANRGKIAGRRVRAREVELTTTDGAIVLEAEAALRGRFVVASLRGDIDVRLRRHGVVLVRARGTRVSLGPGISALRNRPAGWGKASPAGWIDGQIGGQIVRFGAGAPAAIVELQSRHGIVQFSIIE